MYQSSSHTLQKYLREYGLTPLEFAQISGMPISEVRGLLQGYLPFTALRANHLAAVFNTSTETWRSEQAPQPVLEHATDK